MTAAPARPPRGVGRVVGLTGGIATGKSTVSRMLADAGAKIVDADAIAHGVTAKPQPAWREIRERFGEEILRPDGEIDRARLGWIVFKDPQERKALEAIVHPKVREETDRKVQDAFRENPDAWVVLDIPLLFETGMDASLSEIIVVYAPEAVQLARLMKRESIDRQTAMDRIRSQLSIEEKKRRATIVIDNSGDLTDTRRQVLALIADRYNRR